MEFLSKGLLAQPIIEQPCTALRNGTPNCMQQTAGKKIIPKCLLYLQGTHGVLVNPHHIKLSRWGLQLHIRTLQPHLDILEQRTTSCDLLGCEIVGEPCRNRGFQHRCPFRYFFHILWVCISDEMMIVSQNRKYTMIFRSLKTFIQNNLSRSNACEERG